MFSVVAELSISHDNSGLLYSENKHQENLRTCLEYSFNFPRKPTISVAAHALSNETKKCTTQQQARSTCRSQAQENDLLNHEHSIPDRQ
jgi:hypothetical protein